MSVKLVVDASEELVRAAGELTPSPRMGAAALALALGRVCSLPGVDLDAAVALARLARDGEDLHGLRFEELNEELFDARRR